MVTPHDKKAVLGLVASTEQANGVVEALKLSGFCNDDISALLPGAACALGIHGAGPRVGYGASAGVVIGGTLGLLAGVGALAIPGVDTLIAAGPIMAALSGVAATAAAGGLVGGLIGFGVPETEARQYEGKIRGGNILLSVGVDDAAWRKWRPRGPCCGPEARAVLESHGVTDILTVGQASPKRADEPGMSVRR